MVDKIEIIQQTIYSLAIALFLVYITTLPRRSLFFSSILFISLLLGINLISLYHGSSLIEIIRGMVGDVSIASGIFLLLIIANQFNFKDNKKPLLSLSEKITLVVSGLLLYLSTFGFIGFDIYHLGYLSPWTIITASALIFILIIFNRHLGYIWLLSIAGFYFCLQSSNNLWDYLFDPVLWLILVVNLVGKILGLLL